MRMAVNVKTGELTLRPFSQSDRLAMGNILTNSHVRKTYMIPELKTQALKGAVEDLFNKDFEEVVAGAFVENPASIRVMIKAGMTKCPEEEDIEYQGKVHHCVYYSIKKK